MTNPDLPRRDPYAYTVASIWRAAGVFWVTFLVVCLIGAMLKCVS